MSDSRIVWSDEHGDMRKKGKQKDEGLSVNESELSLLLRRLTSGRGRCLIEIKGLPNNKKWCKNLAKDLKKKLGVGGAYKNDYIEIHLDDVGKVGEVLDAKSLSWKKVGG